MKPDNEMWKPVPGFEGAYEVSDHGRVRSKDRIKKYVRRDQYSGRDLEIVRHHKGRVLRPGPKKSGHLTVVLGRRMAGGAGSVQVHALVLNAFVGPCPPNHEALHGDGSSANNRLDNLRWGTRSENILEDIARGVRDNQYGWSNGRTQTPNPMP